MGRRNRKGRNVSGILLLDKPAGITSNGALQRVKSLFFAQKAGHTGSLDPIATGILPICLGEATKFSGFLLNANKSYLAECQLGVVTRSGDTEGEVVSERPVEKMSEERIRQALQQFEGEIQQIPPMHSAVKVNGQPLYKLAHQGLEIEREPRTVTIYELEFVSYDAESERMEIHVHCSKGTYVRTLVEDIGEILECGAHVTALRRTTLGPYLEQDLLTLEQLEIVRDEEGKEGLDQRLLSLDTAVDDYEAVQLDADSSYYVRQGQPVQISGAPDEGWVRIYDESNKFLGVGEIIDDGRVAPRRLVAS
ncbi:MAG: tRNA pseudouridine(55) synthase TruB [Gammaproteobacteria bacterium]|jgi:tRNA pseudouridine55 synthase|nr:tRNA pseudouridine(55) synthase TruB [Gammaproteobacteria bacterium]MBT3717950.1 tRNA pseudouridine(55) synthase TruB [Gammaproteobacteria bacterium]MBT3844155.1 tRNA pseudouridine(55) synthase TruB [Gammaproteobacteria bacterium]MBT3893071.1 tRNA pseudouridine(55) synthase TruB [Gammaproteobacteria bacterium]MBT4299781.1 tRNA pseudouridine(55) synthase TruB [Gammaproteobacteria bacterium]